jgi:hypothetical protein
MRVACPGNAETKMVTVVDVESPSHSMTGAEFKKSNLDAEAGARRSGKFSWPASVLSHK